MSQRGETAASRPGLVPLLLWGLLAAAAGVIAEWVTWQSGGLIRLEVLVLAVIFAEARSWVHRLAGALGAGAFLVALDAPLAWWYLLAIGLVVSAVAAWLLRRFEGRRSSTAPALRFAASIGALALLSLVAGAVEFALAALLPPMSDLLAHYEGPVGHALVNAVLILVPLLLVGALWSRTLLVDQQRWLGRLSLAYVILAATIALPVITDSYWQRTLQEDLRTAATSVATSLDAGLSAAQGAFLARASQPPRSPFADQEGFAAVDTVSLAANASISALALLAPQGDGYRMLYEIDRQGTTPALAPLLGAGPADAAKVKISGEAGAPVFLGVRNVPGADATPLPSLVWVAPQAEKNATTQQYLATAISIPTNISEAISTLGPEGAKLNFQLVSTDPAGTDPVDLSFGPPMVEGAPSVAAESPISFGATQVEVLAAPGEGFGITSTRKMTILLLELGLGLLALGLVLQVANSRFRIQRRLEEREDLLAAAIESAPGRVILLDRARRVVMTNADLGQEGDLDATSDASRLGVYESLPFVVPEAERGPIDAVIASALAGTPASVEHVDVGSGDRVHIHEVSASPIASREDVPASALVQVTDVTEARSAAMRSAQSERLESLGAMAGGLAHDFNNLLFIINGYLQLLQGDGRIQSNDDLSRYVAHAGDAAERGAEIAKSLLSVTRSQPLNASAVNVGTFLQGIMPLARQALGDQRTVDLRIGDGTLDVMVDPGQLSSSLLNLVINSRDATEPGGSVLLSADRRRVEPGDDELAPGEYVVLSVTDDGTGMAPEVAGRAFEPFYSTKAVGQGSGLGLASVYSFARQSGGIAQITSRPGAGATVSMVIPAVFGRELEQQARADGGVGAVSRVLVVDDEQTLAGLVAGWIMDRGAEVRVADSMESALAVAEDFGPDTLLTDMNIGADVDGLDVAARITLAHPEIAVVFMTGFSDRMAELQQRGMTTLAKPFGRQELYRVLFGDADAGAAAGGPGAASATGGGHAGG